MELSDFTFDLPGNLIAQRPLPERDASRLMVVSKATGELEHRSFADLPDYLRAGDLLVLNDTKVMPARVFGTKATGGRIELLLAERLPGEAEQWRCMARPSKGLAPGSALAIGGVKAEVVGRDGEGLLVIRFSSALDLERVGSMPLPPYIRREADQADGSRYQTVYAGPEGAVAAPTAGLHFTGELMERMEAKGVELRRVTLHTGPGTFMPVRSSTVEEHTMMRERYSIPAETFSAVEKARAEGRRVVAVGTTSTRALEASVLGGFGSPRLEGATDLFIYPGFSFRAVDALVTNFHLPCSTLLMLVCAFAGRQKVLRAYREAVESRYRFFSYGDAMLLL